MEDLNKCKDKIARINKGMKKVENSSNIQQRPKSAHFSAAAKC